MAIAWGHTCMQNTVGLGASHSILTLIKNTKVVLGLISSFHECWEKIKLCLKSVTQNVKNSIFSACMNFVILLPPENPLRDPGEASHQLH